MSTGIVWEIIFGQFVRKGRNGYINMFFFPCIKEILRRLQVHVLLDYGCGDGELLNYIRENLSSVKLFGYDISKSMRNLSRQRFQDLSILDCINENIRYDCICLNLVLQDVDRPIDLLEELQAYLCEGGRIVISLPQPVFSLIESEHLTTQRIIQNPSGARGIHRYLFEEAEKVYWNDNNWTLLYNRTFSAYSDIFSRAGYVISSMYEPLPITNGKFDKELYQIYSSIPKFILYCIKSQLC